MWCGRINGERIRTESLTASGWHRIREKKPMKCTQGLRDGGYKGVHGTTERASGSRRCSRWRQQCLLVFHHVLSAICPWQFFSSLLCHTRSLFQFFYHPTLLFNIALERA